MNSSLSKIVIALEYEGTAYCGFQFQENGPTVQAEIEKAILSLTGESIRVTAASRTDAGVHARYQVAAFRTRANITGREFAAGLNHFLPADIAVKESYHVNMDFNVQLDAVSRQYHYLIHNCTVRSAFQRCWSYQVPRRLDIEAMNEACKALTGQHDLASFITAYSKSVIRTTQRIVYSAGVERLDDQVIFDITAKSFLPHQVRNTVGSLIKVGLGRITINGFKSILEAKKPGLAGPTVPARGLYLIRVNYPGPLGDYDEDLQR